MRQQSPSSLSVPIKENKVWTPARSTFCLRFTCLCYWPLQTRYDSATEDTAGVSVCVCVSLNLRAVYNVLFCLSSVWYILILVHSM